MNSNWTPDDDKRLLAAIKRCGGIRAAARELGISESGAIARNARMHGKVYASDALRAEQKKIRVRERRRREQEAIFRLRSLVAKGADRRTAILIARGAGATLMAIGSEFGISHERVRQIALGI